MEINGTLRVDNLPETNTGTIYNGATTATTTFTGTKTVVSDAQGTVGTLPFLPHPVVLVGGTTEDAVTTPQWVQIRASNNPVSTQNLRTASFTLDRKSMVVFNSTLSATSVQNYWGTNFIFDGKVKRIASSLYLNDIQIATMGTPYTNYDPAQTGGVSGQFYTTINKVLILEAGTYTVRLEGSLLTSEVDFTGISARFGASTLDVLDVIAYPMP